MDTGDSPIFQARFYDREGIPADPDTVTGWLKEPDATVRDLPFSQVEVGVWEATYTLFREGEHWVRVLGGGAIQTASEKMFMVATRKVPD